MKQTQTFEERFHIILPQALEHFETNVRRIQKEEPDYYEYKPASWLKIKNMDKKFEYLMNHDYWVRIWSNFLIKMLVDEIYRDNNREFTFNPN